MVLKGSKGLYGKGFKLLAATLVVGVGLLSAPAMAEQAATGQPAPAAEAVAPIEAAAVPVEEAAPPAPEGDYNTGMALFTGEKAFANGGPPCISCHNASVGALGGGVLGPDLTKAYVDESKNPLLSTGWVNGGGSPTMGPIFSAKNITEEEMGHLREFLKGQGQKDVVPAATGTFAGIGIIGFVGVLILFSIIWSGRYSKRNQNTAHEALWRNYGGKGGRV